jgi:hypothetical protein
MVALCGNKIKQRKEIEMFKLIGYGIFLGLGYWGTLYAADLWIAKNGFWWGLGISILFGFCSAIVSGASEQAFRTLTKEGKVSGFISKIISLIFACGAFYVGYNILLIGWSIWWTGFWASILIGIPGLLIGGFMLLLSPIHFLLTLLPRSWWVKFVK